MKAVLWFATLAVGVLSWMPRAFADDASTLELVDFAYSQALAPAPDRALQTAIIPVEVYRGTLRKSLADVRVFDPTGEEVPHAIRRLPPPKARPRAPLELPLFPVRESPDGTSNGELSIHIERDAEGEVIDIRSVPSSDDDREPDSVEPRGRIVSYILDARRAGDPITKLTVTVPDPGRDYVLPVEVESSGDLENWSPVASRGPLVRLDFEGNRIEHDEVVVASTKAKYLRLSWPGTELPAEVTSIVVETQPPDLRPMQRSVEVVGNLIAGETEAYLFDAEGFVPADRVWIRLMTDNDFVKGELSSSDDESGPWDLVKRGRVYRVVENGQAIMQPEWDIGRRAPRFWRLDVTAGEKKRSASRVPVLRITFLPDQLLFVSRGPGDHLLAYGSYKASPSDFDVSDLAELARRGSEPLPRSTVEIGPQEAVTGVKALQEPPPPPPIRTYMLWAVLIVATVVLAVFAARLLRQQS